MQYCSSYLYICCCRWCTYSRSCCRCELMSLVNTSLRTINGFSSSFLFSLACSLPQDISRKMKRFQKYYNFYTEKREKFTPEFIFLPVILSMMLKLNISGNIIQGRREDNKCLSQRDIGTCQIFCLKLFSKPISTYWFPLYFFRSLFTRFFFFSSLRRHSRLSLSLSRHNSRDEKNSQIINRMLRTNRT